MELTPSQKYIDEKTLQLRQAGKRMADVIKLTGINDATISRARHGRTSLSHATIARIDEAVKELTDD